MDMGNTMRTGFLISARMSPQFIDCFEIFVSDVPSDVCKLLLQSQWQALYSIFVGVTEYEASVEICDTAEKVELAYEFYRDINIDASDVPESESHKIQRCNYNSEFACGSCEEGLCISFCSVNAKCAKSYDDPRLFVCCQNENVVGGYGCSSVTEDGKCSSSNNKCCPPEKPLRQYNGECFDCNTNISVNVVQDYSVCNACSENRMMSSKFCERISYFSGTFAGFDGICYACNMATDIDVTTDTTQCDLCPNSRILKGTVCVWKG